MANVSTLFDLTLEGKTIHRDSTLSQAIKEMEKTGARSLLVQDSQGYGVGVLSEHDIVQAFSVEGDCAKDKIVSQYMTLDLVVAEDQADLNYVIKLMSLHNVRHLPVISGNGRVVSFLNVLQVLSAKLDN